MDHGDRRFHRSISRTSDERFGFSPTISQSRLHSGRAVPAATSCFGAGPLTGVQAHSIDPRCYQSRARIDIKDADGTPTRAVNVDEKHAAVSECGAERSLSEASRVTNGAACAHVARCSGQGPRSIRRDDQSARNLRSSLGGESLSAYCAWMASVAPVRLR